MDRTGSDYRRKMWIGRVYCREKRRIDRKGLGLERRE